MERKTETVMCKEHSSSPLEILLVEDNPGDAELIQEILKESNAADFVVTWAEQLSETRDRSLGKRFDLALLDLSLPDSSGLETVIRARKEMRNLPIVVLTGAADGMLGLAAMQAGAQDYLVKGTMDGNHIGRVILYSIERQRIVAHLAEAQRVARIGSYQYTFETGETVWSEETYSVFDRDRALGPPTHEELMACFHPDDLPRLVAARLQAVEHDRPYDLDIRIRQQDGSYRWARNLARHISNVKGESIGIVGTLMDIHERKLAEERIRTNEENLNHAQALAHIGSWELDLRTGLGRWSDEMFRLYGLEPAPAPPSFEKSLLRVHPEDRTKVADHAAAAGAGEELDFRLLLPDGTLRYVHALVELVTNENGAPGRLRGTLTDVTQRRLAEGTIRALNTAMERATEGIARVDADGCYKVVNDAFALMLGCFTEELSCRHWLTAFAPEDYAMMCAEYDRMKTEGKVSFEVQGIRGEGLRSCYEVTAVSDLDTDGRFLGHYAFTRDITARKAAQTALHESETRFRSAIESMTEGLTLQTREGEIVVHNRRAAEILGLTDDQLLGRASLDPCWDIVHEDGTPWQSRTHPVMITLREGVAQSGVVAGVQKPNGELAWISINCAPIFHVGESRPYSAVVTFSDITELKHLALQVEAANTFLEGANTILVEQQAELIAGRLELEALATTDGLTGLKNHRTFQERLVEEYKRAVREGSPLSVLLLDVDHFKMFNDRYGHPAGDRVLKQVAAVMLAEGRVSDVIARYGGEEFAMILPGADTRGAMECGNRVRAAVAARQWEQRAITVSVGVTTLQVSTENSAALVTEADRALYNSKAAGRNRVTQFRMEPWGEGAPQT